MYIMQTCIVEHHIMQHCITAHKIMKHYIIGRYIMQHCILKCHIMQACIVKHKIAQICARQTFPFIFAALEIKLAVWPIDRTTSLLCQSLQSVIRQLENCNGDSNSIDTIMYRVDWLYGCMGKRYPTCTWCKRSYNVNVQRRWQSKLAGNFWEAHNMLFQFRVSQYKFA